MREQCTSPLEPTKMELFVQLFVDNDCTYVDQVHGDFMCGLVGNYYSAINQVTFTNGHGPSVAAMHVVPTIYGRVAPTLLQYS